MAKPPLHPDPATLLAEVDARMRVALPEPVCELDHDDAWQLLIVTILSAQAKDSVINEIRGPLFARWPRPADLAAAPKEEVEEVVKRSGYYRNKAKAIRECAAAVVERHDGEVPAEHEALIALPGASHKTANLVLGIAFGVASGIVVDTHVARVSERLGIVGPGKKPEQIESRLCELVPRERWVAISHELILHGRHLCKAQSPDCGACPINDLCGSRSGGAGDDWRTLAQREGELFAVRGDRSRAGWPAGPSKSPAGPPAAAAKQPASSPKAPREDKPVYVAPREEEDDF